MLRTFDKEKQELQLSVDLVDKLKTTRYNARIDNRVGGSKPALILLQLQYWLDKKGISLDSRDGLWYMAAIKEWKECNFSSWSESSIKNAIAKLERLGLVISCTPRVKEGNRTKAYSICFDKFNSLLENVLEEEGRELSSFQGELFDNSCDLGVNPSINVSYNKSKFLTSNIQINKYSGILASNIGEKESVMLLQIHHHLTRLGSEKIVDRQGLWIYNSIEDWGKQFSAWGRNSIIDTLKNLEQSGYITSSKKLKSEGKHVKWYSINFDSFNPLIENAVIQQEKAANGNKDIVQGKMFFGSLESNKTQETPAISRVGKKQTIDEVKTKQSYIGKAKNRISNISSNDKSNVKIDIVTNEVNRKINFISLSKEDEKVAKDMISVWNKYMPSKLNVVYSNNRAKKLIVLYKEQLDSCLEKWKEFVLAVNSSKFLMGEKTEFKIYFDWIIKPEQVSRVLAGEFGIGDRTPDYKQAEEHNAYINLVRKQKSEVFAKIAKQREEEQAERLYTQEKEEYFSNMSVAQEQELRSSYEQDYLTKQQARLGSENQMIKPINWSDVMVRMGYEVFKNQYFKKQRESGLYTIKTTENISLGNKIAKLYDTKQII